MDKNEYKNIINSIEKAVEMEQMAGVDELLLAPSSGGKRGTMDDRGGMINEARENKEDGRLQEKYESLDDFKPVVQACQKCQLAETRTNVVFGEGVSNARLMFVGEAPGRDEDEQARPFVGRAGKLLTKIIGSIGLKREEVFIANILKCRPPNNRNPLPGEIQLCTPHLLKQIEIIKPKVICALGKFAAQTLLNTETPISKLRGKFYDYHGVNLMPTYHPAYLLRNSAGKKDVWDDMRAIARELGISLPSKHAE